jgi:hypothetical protein
LVVAAAAVQFSAIHSDALAVLLGLVPLPDSVWQLFSQQVSVHQSNMIFFRDLIVG